ncbi:hypothetical protein [Arenibaculum pallidiluteum]|uniref:hypothetical protein n=1 Tax=Arenibaculum pallidiluteum TaxID=2812559 RepID=UPI001A9611F7|nr:hypothetical protein [Arenibaculum pallidiluteum]
MEDWTTVQFAETPDLPTRKAILSWVEREVGGRVLHFSTMDWSGRRQYGFRFQQAEDARRFTHRWLPARIDA